jgi:MoaA/NifB/PqqE/SkfB family radical SAM enzyme/Flp pilus assembly protein TadD
MQEAIDRDFHLSQGVNLRDKGNYNLALEEFELVIGANPHDDIAWLELGKTYKMMDKCRQAINGLIQAIRINPHNKEAIVELGETSRMSDNCVQAIQELKAIVAKDITNEYAYVELGKIYQRLGRLEFAIEAFNKAYAINPYNGATVLGLGQVYKFQGRIDEAVRKFKEALKIDPHDKEAHAELGRLYLLQNNYSEAVKEIRAAIDISPLDAKLRLELIQIYVKQGRLDLSEQEAREALEVAPKDPFLQDWLLNEIEIVQGKTVLKTRVKRLWVTVTTRCNIRCRTCGLWSNPWDLPRKTAEEVMALYPYLERIVWLGGEVFLYKFFDEMFQRATAFPRLRQQIITNGVILTQEWIERIVRANVELTFSVDGITKEVYEHIRRGAKFEKLIKNIEIVNELRQRYHSQTKMRLNALIMKSNYHQIEGFLDFAKNYNFEQASLLAVHFDEDPEENILYSKKDDKALKFITESIPRVRQKARDYNIDLDILLPTEDLKFDEFENNDETPSGIRVQKEAVHCKMPWKYLFICDDGKVYLTGSCLRTVGNIYESSLDEIWNSPQAQLYRESMLKNKFQGLCRCECMTRWEA